MHIRTHDDVLWARQEARRFASGLPFPVDDLHRIDIAASELASNMVKHAGGGRLELLRIARGERPGIRMTAVDRGPGIEDIEQALVPGFSTAGTLGAGLSSLRELMDKFELETEPGRGTRVEVEKWLRP